MENMHIMCVVVGVMETLYQDVHIASTVPACPFDHIWQLAVANLAQNRQLADQIPSHLDDSHHH